MEGFKDAGFELRLERGGLRALQGAVSVSVRRVEER